MNRYYETHERWPNIANAIKYAFCLVTVIIGSVHSAFQTIDTNEQVDKKNRSLSFAICNSQDGQGSRAYNDQINLFLFKTK